MGLPLNLLMRIIEYSMNHVSSTDHIALSMKLLTDLRYADNVYGLTCKLSDLYLLGYCEYPVDIRMVDCMKPFTAQKLQKLHPDTPMEFELQEEEAGYLGVARVTPQKPPEIPSHINVVQVPIYRGQRESSSPVPIFPYNSLQAKKLTFSFIFSDLTTPRNVVSPCFSSESRKWSVLVSITRTGDISLFLCERGPKEKDSKYVQLLYTSALFELGIDDPGLRDSVRNSGQPQYSACFYSFPNSHYHIVGERNYCKVSSLTHSGSARVNVYIRETGLHSGIMHHLCANFSELFTKDLTLFKEFTCYTMKSLFSHDELNVKNEQEAVSVLWNYGSTTEIAAMNKIVPAIRLQFLPYETLLNIARDHQIIRKTENFQTLFAKEYYRRTANGPITTKPRNSYSNDTQELAKKDQNSCFLDWILRTEHHKGHERRIDEIKQLLQTEKNEHCRKKAELSAKKIQFSASKKEPVEVRAAQNPTGSLEDLRVPQRPSDCVIS